MKIIGLRALSVLFVSRSAIKFPGSVLPQRVVGGVFSSATTVTNIDGLFQQKHLGSTAIYNKISSMLGSPTQSLLKDGSWQNIVCSKKIWLAALLVIVFSVIKPTISQHYAKNMKIPQMETSSPRTTTPIALPLSLYDYIDRSLRKIDANGYKAAGVLLYRQNKANGDIECLLGQNEESELVLLGGKIDGTDKNMYDTAIREFNEETSMLLNPKVIKQIREKLVKAEPVVDVLWNSGGKYALCMLPVESLPGLYEATQDLPLTMKTLRNDPERWEALPPHCSEVSGLCWVSITNETVQRSRFLKLLWRSPKFRAWLNEVSDRYHS